MTNLETHPHETECTATGAAGPVRERYEARQVPLGGLRAAVVSRTLPHRELSTVGAWCFLDAFTPGDAPMNVLPHPHIGLQTVTWPLEGRMLHRDSLGSEQLLRPGELNLMTSGAGVSHSEFTVDDVGARGLQLWVALPDPDRHADAAFEHVGADDLPVVETGGVRARVFVGELDGVSSPAHVHTPLVGAQIDLSARSSAAVPLRPDFEYAVQTIDGEVRVAGERLEPGPLLYLGTGREELPLAADGVARLLLLGGEPLGEDLLMWWNFVGRTHAEIAEAREDWEAHSVRFGTIPAHGDERIPAPALPNVRLTPRRRRHR
ncbi:Pirin domain protein [Beutenbergia cavernae DSM 12333]|uniref:Pirin domain protein n=1 Tax=Beutenbergia cavernae (strain ATCC BAA-8 / DSM 12333 / CCUG 43141 / JCM 11478 / NBRC 16432 / NCIMB 13614 / HKI 0122) TaxID=471853 RepID=C5C293_BEUC1|nr:pirin family protein [Beutenbergia cavernae]ACQ81718.1 Pirin domain protein [Beutenbergia cavernae DSM 12333]